MSKYIRLNESSINYITLEEFLMSEKTANICDIYTGEISEKLLSKYGVYLVTETEKPEEEEGYVIEEGSPKYVHDKWIQTWIKKKLNTK